MALTVGKCPNCGEAIYETQKGFSCSGWSNKEAPCRFTIWKESYGAQFTLEDAKTILAGKSVRKVNRAMNGDNYEADWFHIKGQEKLAFKKVVQENAEA